MISAGDARDYRYGVASVLGEQLASRPEVNTSSAAYELGRADARRRLEQGARLVRFMADYISTSRNLGPEYRAELERAVLLLSGEDGEFDGNRRYEFGIIPEGETGGRAYCDYGSTLVYQLSRTDPEVLASALRAETARRARDAEAATETEATEEAGSEPAGGQTIAAVAADRSLTVIAETHRIDISEQNLAGDGEPGTTGPAAGESVRTYLRRTPHEFAERQGTAAAPLAAEPFSSCACGLAAADPVHSGAGLLPTPAYLNQVTGALNERDDGPDDPAERLHRPPDDGVRTLAGPAKARPRPRQGPAKAPAKAW